MKVILDYGERSGVMALDNVSRFTTPMNLLLTSPLGEIKTVTGISPPILKSEVRFRLGSHNTAHSIPVLVMNLRMKSGLSF